MSGTERPPWRAISILAVAFLLVIGGLALVVGALTGVDIGNPVLARISDGEFRLTGWGWFVVWFIVVAAL